MKNSIEPIIRVDHLSKRYRIGGQETYTRLRDSARRSRTPPFKTMAQWPEFSQDNWHSTT